MVFKNKFFELKTAFSFHVEKKINSFYSIATEISSGSFAGLRRANEYIGYNVFEQWEKEVLYEGNGDKFTASFTEADLLLNLNLT